MRLKIDSAGQIRCLYDESMDLAELGRVSIRRASFVEPDVNGQWHADLAPLNGPQLGPYPSRQGALEAEKAWLEANWLGLSGAQ
jgi:hypothetical protein